MRADLTPEDLQSLAHDCAVLAQLLAYGNVADFIQPLGKQGTSLAAYFPRTAASLEGAGDECIGGQILMAQLEYARYLGKEAPEALPIHEADYAPSASDRSTDYYALHSFVPPFSPALQPDHLACLLSFAQHLCQNIALNHNAVVCAQDLEQFSERHLLTWAFEFCDDLKDAAESNFWIDVAQLLRATLRQLA